MGCVTCWKNTFGDFFDGARISDRRHVNTSISISRNNRQYIRGGYVYADDFPRKHYRRCDVIYRYLHIELIWCLLMVHYLQNNVIMKWTTRFIRFTGWIPSKYGSTTTPPIIAHCQKTPMSSLVFHIMIPKTSNIRRTPSFDLLTDEFSKRVSISRRALY